MVTASGAGRGSAPARLDPTMPLLALLGLFLALLVLLPLGWLGWYSLTDAEGRASLGNFVQLVADPGFRRPYLTALLIAVCVALASGAAATPLAWLVARSDLPLARAIR